MRIKIILGYSLFIIIGCSTSNTQKVLKRETGNPIIPYVYTNGYKDYTLKPFLTIENKDTIAITELRFNAVESSMYTQKLMYDRFGKWTQELKQPNYKTPTLLWENVKLFENQNKYYTVAANGIESFENIYASVMVYDSENNDCLSASYKEKETIIDYFLEGIKNLNPSDAFYVLYHKKFD